MKVKIPFFWILLILVVLIGNSYCFFDVFANGTSDFSASIIPSDPLFNKQWYLKRIKAVETWDKYWDASSIVIAVIDSGVQIDHPDLKDNIWVNNDEIPGNKKDDDNNGFIDDFNGWDFVENNSDPNPKYDNGYNKDGIMHGTVVAGVVAASGNNFLGVTGIAWNARIMPLRVLNGSGEGNAKSVIRAIDYAIKNGADIINLSFVGAGYSQNLEEAIRRAYNAGIIIVAAAGNDINGGSSHFLDKDPLYPVCYDGKNGENMVIGVAATDSLDQKAIFSGYGGKCIDISAPGISVYSTAVKKNGLSVFNNYYDGYWAGTSMAVPMVSGAIALIEAANPNLSKKEVIDILLKNVDNIDNLNPNYIGKLGKGRLNIYASVNNSISAANSKSTNLVIARFFEKNNEIILTDNNGNVIKKITTPNTLSKSVIDVVTDDVDNDNFPEIIVGVNNQIKIFDTNGKIKKQFLAFNKNFNGGVNVAVGDVDGDGLSEIVVGAGAGIEPLVKIFDTNGKIKKQFLAFNKNFNGGVNVAVGDVDGDGLSEIVVGAGFNGGPQVRIFSGTGKLKGQYFAYDKKFRGGVNVAVGIFNNRVRNANSMIVTTPGVGGGPQIKIFDNHFNLRGQFLAYSEHFRGGVNTFIADVNHDGMGEIITGAGPGGTPHVRVFSNNGKLISSFYAFEASFSNGVSVTSIKL